MGIDLGFLGEALLTGRTSYREGKRIGTDRRRKREQDAEQLTYARAQDDLQRQDRLAQLEQNRKQWEQGFDADEAYRAKQFGLKTEPTDPLLDPVELDTLRPYIKARYGVDLPPSMTRGAYDRLMTLLPSSPVIKDSSTTKAGAGTVGDILNTDAPAQTVGNVLSPTPVVMRSPLTPPIARTPNTFIGPRDLRTPTPTPATPAATTGLQAMPLPQVTPTPTAVRPPLQPTVQPASPALTGTTGTPYNFDQALMQRATALAMSNGITVPQAVDLMTLIERVGNNAQGEATAPLVLRIDEKTGNPVFLRDEQGQVAMVTQSVQSSLQGGINSAAGRTLKTTQTRAWSPYRSQQYGLTTPEAGGFAGLVNLKEGEALPMGLRPYEQRPTLQADPLSGKPTLLTPEQLKVRTDLSKQQADKAEREFDQWAERERIKISRANTAISQGNLNLSRDKHAENMRQIRDSKAPNVQNKLKRADEIYNKFTYEETNNQGYITGKRLWRGGSDTYKREYDRLIGDANEMQYNEKVKEARAEALKEGHKEGTKGYYAYVKSAVGE